MPANSCNLIGGYFCATALFYNRVLIRAETRLYKSITLTPPASGVALPLPSPKKKGIVSIYRGWSTYN